MKQNAHDEERGGKRRRRSTLRGGLNKQQTQDQKMQQEARANFLITQAKRLDANFVSFYDELEKKFHYYVQRLIGVEVDFVENESSALVSQKKSKKKQNEKTKDQSGATKDAVAVKDMVMSAGKHKSAIQSEISNIKEEPDKERSYSGSSLQSNISKQEKQRLTQPKSNSSTPKNSDGSSFDINEPDLSE